MKNTIDVIAKFEYDFYTAQSNFIFYKEMSTDSRIREESLKADEKFEDKETDAWMDTKLYEAINKFKQDSQKSSEWNNLKDEDKRYVDTLLTEFKRKGIHLEAKDRDEVKSLQKNIRDLERKASEVL